MVRPVSLLASLHRDRPHRGLVLYRHCMVAGPRVLLVEADDDVVVRVRRLVEILDGTARVVPAATVAEAIERAEAAHPIDAAIISAQLPDGSGLRVVQWLHGNPDPPPTVVMASGETAELWEAAVRSGVAVLLARESLTAERLRAALTLAMDRSRSERLARLVTDAAVGLEADDRIDAEVGAILAELVAVTGVHGARLSVRLPGEEPTLRWTRGEVHDGESPAFTVVGRTGAAVTLLELVDHHNRSWTTIRRPLTTLCEVVAAALLRRQGVQQVQASEARLRSLAENVPDAIVSVDARGYVAAANRRFARAVGHDDPVGEPLVDLVRGRCLAALAVRAVEEGRRSRSSVALPDEAVVVADGDERWYGAKATADSAGTVHVVLPDTTDRVLSERRLTELALTDHLTGLANRRLAIDRLQHALDQVGRGQSHLVVSLCDVDRFKSTNDLFGHAAGDGVLLALSERLRASVRLADTAARLGGDEFLIISEAVDSADAARGLVHRLHGALCGPVEVDGDELELSVSLGYVVVSEPGRSADDILRLADHALYAAKAAGRGQYATYEPPAATSTHDEAIEQLERAWRDGRFVLRWAPAASLDGSIRSARAMLWWFDVDGSEREPDELATALSSGPLFGPVRRWVMGQALEQRARLLRAGLVDDDFAIHVRVFARQLADPDLAADVLAQLERSAVPGHALVLDLEDGALLASPAALERLGDLAQAGVRLYLDRFGSGPVDLAPLVRGPISGVRIDAELMRDVWRDPSRSHLVDCLLALGTAAGLDLIVDGIDHTEQLSWLGSRRPVAISGPLVAEPLTFEPFVARLSGQRAEPPVGPGDDHLAITDR